MENGPIPIENSEILIETMLILIQYFHTNYLFSQSSRECKKHKVPTHSISFAEGKHLACSPMASYRQNTLKN